MLTLVDEPGWKRKRFPTAMRGFRWQYTSSDIDIYPKPDKTSCKQTRITYITFCCTIFRHLSKSRYWTRLARFRVHVCAQMSSGWNNWVREVFNTVLLLRLLTNYYVMKRVLLKWTKRYCPARSFFRQRQWRSLDVSISPAATAKSRIRWHRNDWT